MGQLNRGPDPRFFLPFDRKIYIFDSQRITVILWINYSGSGIICQVCVCVCVCVCVWACVSVCRCGIKYPQDRKWANTKSCQWNTSPNRTKATSQRIPNNLNTVLTCHLSACLSVGQQLPTRSLSNHNDRYQIFRAWCAGSDGRDQMGKSDGKNRMGKICILNGTAWHGLIDWTLRKSNLISERKKWKEMATFPKNPAWGKRCRCWLMDLSLWFWSGFILRWFLPRDTGFSVFKHK